MNTVTLHFGAFRSKVKFVVDEEDRAALLEYLKPIPELRHTVEAAFFSIDNPDAGEPVVPFRSAASREAP